MVLIQCCLYGYGPYEEWGDPRKEEYYYYMKSYSPVDIKAQDYPNILVTAGLNDPCVMYSEPAKFVAKLREMKTDDNLLLFKCEVPGTTPSREDLRSSRKMLLLVHLSSRHWA